MSHSKPAPPNGPAAMLTIACSGRERFQQLYPAIDVLRELRAMRGWLIGNPRNRKTASGILRFINGWLKRAQDRAPAVPGPYPSEREVHLSARAAVGRHEPEPAPLAMPAPDLPADLDKDKGRDAWGAILNRISKGVPRVTFETWFKPVRTLGVSNSRVLYLRVPDPIGERTLHSRSYQLTSSKMA